MGTNCLLTPTEAASILKISKKTILRWAKEKKIECVRISKKTILFQAEAIDTFVNERIHGVQSPAGRTPKPRGHQIRSKPTKGGEKQTGSRESWGSLRKEILSWQ